MDISDFPFGKEHTNKLSSPYRGGIFARFHMQNEQESLTYPMLTFDCKRSKDLALGIHFMNASAKTIKDNMEGNPKPEVIQKIAKEINYSDEMTQEICRMMYDHTQTITLGDPGLTRVPIIVKSQEQDNKAVMWEILNIPGPGSDPGLQKIFYSIIFKALEAASEEIRKGIRKHNECGEDIRSHNPPIITAA